MLVCSSHNFVCCFDRHRHSIIVALLFLSFCTLNPLAAKSWCCCSCCCEVKIRCWCPSRFAETLCHYCVCVRSLLCCTNAFVSLTSPTLATQTKINCTWTLCAHTFKVEENVNKIYSNCCCLLLRLMTSVVAIIASCIPLFFTVSFFIRLPSSYLPQHSICFFVGLFVCSIVGENVTRARRSSSFTQHSKCIICTALQLNGIISRFAYVLANTAGFH